MNTTEFLASLGQGGEREMDKSFGHKRKFLNRSHGLAAVEWAVNGSIWTPKQGPKAGSNKVDVQADFTVSDCNRQVTLDFGVWDKKDLKAKLQKVRDFEDQVSEFARTLEEALEWAEEEGIK